MRNSNAGRDSHSIRSPPPASASGFTVKLLLNSERMARLVEYHSRSSEYPGLPEVTESLLERTWKAPSRATAYLEEVQQTMQARGPRRASSAGVEPSEHLSSTSDSDRTSCRPRGLAGVGGDADSSPEASGRGHSAFGKNDRTVRTRRRCHTSCRREAPSASTETSLLSANGLAWRSPARAFGVARH